MAVKKQTLRAASYLPRSQMRSIRAESCRLAMRCVDQPDQREKVSGEVRVRISARRCMMVLSTMPNGAYLQEKRAPLRCDGEGLHWGWSQGPYAGLLPKRVIFGWSGGTLRPFPCMNRSNQQQNGVVSDKNRCWFCVPH